jgi:D-alanyl-D-alanine carboxypeptidase
MEAASEKNDPLAEILSRLGLTVAATEGLRPFPEAAELVAVGPDAFGRDAQLAPDAASAWLQMCVAARLDGVQLLLVSAFRSYEYQAHLWDRKLRAGEAPDEIRRVLGIPGFSQHHTGWAVDIGSPECRDLTEAFERTAEFGWLTRHAGRFAFTLPYPRGNRHGVTYEPWHWVHGSGSGFTLD